MNILTDQGFWQAICTLTLFILFNVGYTIYKFIKANKRHKQDKERGHDKTAVGGGKYTKRSKSEYTKGKKTM